MLCNLQPPKLLYALIIIFDASFRILLRLEDETSAMLVLNVITMAKISRPIRGNPTGCID